MLKTLNQEFKNFHTVVFCNDLLKNSLRNLIDIKSSSEVLIIGNPPVGNKFSN